MILQFKVSTKQKFGDVVLLLIMLPLGVIFIGGFLLLMSVLIVFIAQGESTTTGATGGFMGAAAAIATVLVYLLPMPWWSVQLDTHEVVLKTIRSLRIPYESIELIQAGLQAGMQNKGHRSEAVPLTIEEHGGRKTKIYLAPADAQFCIEYLTRTCAWIGGLGVDGTAILPREPKARAAAKKRLGRMYLYSGLPALILSGVAMILILPHGTAIFRDSDNPAQVVVGLLAMFTLISYGLWAVKKYRNLQDVRDE